jgi:hypothetical protein
MYPIASTTISSPTSNISFTSIPQNFTHLEFRIFARCAYDRGSGNTVPLSAYFQFNADTTTNYWEHRIYGTGASASSDSNNAGGGWAAQQTIPGVQATANVFGSAIFTVLDYTNTNKYKVTRSISGADQNGSGYVALCSTVWNNTNAVNVITFYSDANWVAGTTIQMYGISTSNATGA